MKADNKNASRQYLCFAKNKKKHKKSISILNLQNLAELCNNQITRPSLLVEFWSQAVFVSHLELGLERGHSFMNRVI